MRIQVLNTIALLCFCLPLAHAEMEPKAPRPSYIQEAIELIRSSLRPTEPGAFLPHAEKIVQLETRIEQTKALSLAEAKDLTKMVSHWRFIAKALTFESLESVQSKAAAIEMLRRLRLANAALDISEALELWKHAKKIGMEDADDLWNEVSETLGQLCDANDLIDAKLWSDLSPTGRLLAGPDSIRVPSPASMLGLRPFHADQKWMQWSHSGHYLFPQMGKTVRVRGVDIQEGDFIFVDPAAPPTGHSVVQPSGRCPDMGIVVFVKRNNDPLDIVPVVIEEHPILGLRPVPLNMFLGPRFAYFAEVRRHMNAATIFQNNEELQRLAKSLLGGNRSNRRALQTVLNHILNPSIAMEEASSVDTHTTSASIASSADLITTAIVDNGAFVRNIVRELLIGSPTIPGSFSHRMHGSTLEPDLKQMGLRTRLLYNAVLKLVQKLSHSETNWQQRLFRWYYGSDPDQLPQLTPEELAISAALNKTLRDAAKGIFGGFGRETPGLNGDHKTIFGYKDCGEIIRGHIMNLEPFVLSSVSGDPDIQRVIQLALERAGLGAFFSAAASPPLIHPE